MAEAAAAALGEALEQRLAAGPGRARLMVTGGSTPVACYETLRGRPLDWSRVDIALTDDRFVPPDGPDSNERLVREHLLQGPAAAASLTPLWSDAISPDAAAARAEPAIRALGIFEAVSQVCTEMQRENSIDVKLTVEGLDNLDLEQETEINLFRILQEALTNVRRHAEAKHVRVVLFGFGDYIELTVDDDGCGPRGTPPGLGRTGMEERARMVGGRFYFGHGPWGGASLRVTLPTRRKEAT